MRQHQETTYDRDAVNDAEIVIAESFQDSIGRARYAKEKAHAITQALDEAGFEIRYRPIDIVPEIMGAAVLSAYERIDLPPGRSVKEAVYELTPEAEAVIRAFTESVALMQDPVNAGSDALEREIEGSFAEPLDAVPDEVADQRDAAEAIRCVIQANLLLAMAVEVLGGEAVDLLMHSLPVPDVREAA